MISYRRRRRSSLSPVDKREIHSMSHQNPSGGQSLPSKISYGPFGPLDHVFSRRTFMYLIATLNATHSGHDFTSISPQAFRRERNVRYTLSHILPPTNPTVQSDFFLMLEKEMDWRVNGPSPDCTVYSVDEGTMMDALNVGTVWCTTLFWVNRKLKRVLFLEVQGRSITSPILEATDEMSDWEEEEGVLGQLEMDL
jgi:Maf1 regulator